MAEYKEQRDENNNLVGIVRIKGSREFFIPINTDNSEYNRYLKWVANGGVADSDSNVLAKVKGKKRAEYRAEAVKRIAASVPQWDTYEKIRFLVSFANLLNTGNMNANQTAARNTYLYVKNTAIPNVNAQTTVQDVLNIDVANDPNWP